MVRVLSHTHTYTLVRMEEASLLLTSRELVYLESGTRMTLNTVRPYNNSTVLGLELEVFAEIFKKMRL